MESSVQTTQNYTTDNYETNFLNAKNALIHCQDSKNLSSCLICPSLFNCQTRESYVANVYKKMNRGQSGSFDF
ncbi:hypothetical protein DCO58_11275 [Helicobacter saguini]|uniref:Uncharacterized protein n=1 Tax=Helicobacter saguini TaxID=1548018 RepID=A0A347VQ10_9HELI|nr:hypothetical protein [Helicobacter saguini]MWV61127.1 hypothetical protein [Helicobacter saguini]MWV68204.1 hypothetical protein [Helicobacter saguini]MWV70332.1 hypothetical protein [Helicobacter saguini]MWV72234.1 hypothetical protein [Helicobacter saguini]TLD95282.1 hypothetical protein LS64_002705 [Helicobacter saguini]